MSAKKQAILDTIREVEAERPGMVFGTCQFDKNEVLEELYRQLDEEE